jgi:hypothetical protein
VMPAATAGGLGSTAPSEQLGNLPVDWSDITLDWRPSW